MKYLGEPSAYGHECFIGDPLLHNLPWIPEFDFDLVGPTKLHALEVNRQSLADKLVHTVFRYQSGLETMKR